MPGDVMSLENRFPEKAPIANEELLLCMLFEVMGMA